MLGYKLRKRKLYSLDLFQNQYLILYCWNHGNFKTTYIFLLQSCRYQRSYNLKHAVSSLATYNIMINDDGKCPEKLPLIFMLFYGMFLRWILLFSLKYSITYCAWRSIVCWFWICKVKSKHDITNVALQNCFIQVYSFIQLWILFHSSYLEI